MSETISDTEEEDLVSATKKAVDLVESGLSPNDAIEKVARDRGYAAGRIRVISHAYNTGQQLAQWRGGGAILDKLASYPLADAEAVIGRIYGETKTAAVKVSSDYASPPTWLPSPRKAGLEKAAAALPVQVVPPPNPPDPMTAVRARFNLVDRAKLASDDLSRRASAAADQVRTAVASLVGYFRKAAFDRRSFEEVEATARSYFGAAVTPLMDMVYVQAHMKGLNEKRASNKTPLLKQAADLTASPFSLIKLAMDQAVHCYKLREAHTVSVQQLAEAKENVSRPFAKAGAAKQQADSGLWSPAAAKLFEKKAFGFGTEVAAIALGDIAAHKATHKPEEDDDPYGDVSEINREVDAVRNAARIRLPMQKTANGILGAPAMGAALGTMLGRTVGTVPQPKDDMVEDAWMDLEDPEHQNELRRIRAHALLTQLLTDPDEPISAHPPEKVMNAYNEIAQATPRVAENIATLRPILRKRLEGHPETFETREMIDLEKGIAGARNPTPNTNALSKTPEKLLG